MGLLETKDFGYRVWTWGLGVRSGLCVMRLLPSSSDRTGRVEWKYGEVRRLWSGPSNGAKGRGAFGMGCRLDVVGMEFARFPSRKECCFLYLPDSACAGYTGSVRALLHPHQHQTRRPDRLHFKHASLKLMKLFATWPPP